MVWHSPTKSEDIAVDIIEGSDFSVAIIEVRLLKQSCASSSFHSHRLFRKRSAMNGNYESNFAHKIRGRSLDENAGRENFILQERHLRYLMSSTAEQPDNSSRSSTINIWLTILIAALAAAILS
ncbi:uncharacterized protein NPIL_581371 [Nephila pilipes]|uniref:Uncharacterized protein n=1 Tax=Nephila pilipes TaxID=299642 RepID=A0A8X6QAU0_NEPPI|nr:uncharacterized protein NPIL_581371 [Nephila pilipes]